jgi:hypothetical protein
MRLTYLHGLLIKCHRCELIGARENWMGLNLANCQLASTTGGWSNEWFKMEHNSVTNKSVTVYPLEWNISFFKKI